MSKDSSLQSPFVFLNNSERKKLSYRKQAARNIKHTNAILPANYFYATPDTEIFRKVEMTFSVAQGH